MTNDFSQKVKTLKELREATGRAAQWVADILGVSRKTLYRYEKGDPMELTEARLLAVLYGRSLEDIADSAGCTHDWAEAELARRIEARQGSNHED
jgi:predicted transcriptional regulator